MPYQVTNRSNTSRRRQMEKINFIGAYDKTDSIMYIAKILTEMKKKVIIVDATITQ